MEKIQPKQELTLEETGRMINDGYDSGLRIFYVLGGEPLLRPDILQILEKSKKKVIQIL